MHEGTPLQRKLLLGAGLAAAAAALLVVLLVLLLRGSRPDRGDADRAGIGGGAGATEGLAGPAQATPEPESKAEAPPEKTEAEEPAEPEREPLLRGRVFGEAGGIAGAAVMLFSVREVESLLRRLERFDPGSGLPDIPSLIAGVKEELDRFRASALAAAADAEGLYAFFEAPPGAYFVLAAGAGHVFRYGDVVSLIAGRTQELDLRLDRGVAIAGRVIDIEDRGVPGARVTAEFHPPGMPGVGRIVQKLLSYVNGEFLKGPFQAQTDADGRFAIDALPPGAYDLLAEKPGFPETRLENVLGGTTEAVILLAPGARIEGLLVDGQGLPVPDLEVRLGAEAAAIALPFPGASDMLETANRLFGDPERRARSRESGAFRFENVGPGRYRLKVQVAGFLPLERPLAIAPGETEVQLGALAIDRGAAIRGRVIAQGGAPVEGASVSAFPEGMSFFSMGGAVNDMVSGRNRSATDAAGRFELRGLASGKYNVIAQARGYGGASKRGVAADGEEIEIEVERGIAIRGRVIDHATEAKLSGARVSASGVSAGTDAEGRFALEGVTARGRGLDPFGGMQGGFGGRRGGGRRGPGAAPSGEGDGAPGAGANAGSEGEGEEAQPRRIRVRASAGGYQEGFASVDAGADASDVVISLKAKPRVRGLALDPKGEALPGALLRLVPGDGENPFTGSGLVFVDAGVSDLEGRFVLDAPEESGQFSILASHPLYASTFSDGFRPADLDARDAIEVRLAEGGVIRGTVSDGANPIAGARVRLAKSRQTDARMQIFANLIGLPKEGKVAYSSQSGAFVYELVLPGDYTLSAEVAGFGDSKTENVSVAAGETRELSIVLDPGGEIAGVVLDQDGQPLGGALVRALREGGGDERMLEAQRLLGGAFKTARSGSDGLFRLEGLPSAAYSVIAEKPGYSAASAAAVRPGETRLELLLEAAARLEGRVVDAATLRPIPVFEVRLVDLEREAVGGGEPSPFDFRPWRQARDADGRYFRDGLEPGRCRVEVRADGFAPSAQDIVLASGAVAEVSFALERAGVLTGQVIDASTGQPVEGARVGLASRDGRPPAAEDESADSRREVRRYFEDFALARSVSTDGEGRFELASFPAEPQTVVVTHDEFVQEHRDEVAVAFGEQKELKILFKKGLSLSGTIADAASRPAVGAFVLVKGTSEGFERVRKSATADAEGRFRIGGLERGSYRLIVPSREGRSPPSSQDIAIDERDVEDLRLTLP
jgi:protocatechuate 3,4-dioxygenase beta subunit